jgi:hypothetical protein
MSLYEREFCFRLWDEMKRFALRYEKRRQALPTDHDCERWLRSTLKERNADLPTRAFQFYLAELKAMIAKVKRRRSFQHS